MLFISLLLKYILGEAILINTEVPLSVNKVFEDDNLIFYAENTQKANILSSYSFINNVLKTTVINITSGQMEYKMEPLKIITIYKKNIIGYLGMLRKIWIYKNTLRLTYTDDKNKLFKLIVIDSNDEDLEITNEMMRIRTKAFREKISGKLISIYTKNRGFNSVASIIFKDQNENKKNNNFAKYLKDKTFIKNTKFKEMIENQL